MGFLAPDPGKGPAVVEVEIRGEWVEAARVDPPFLST
jgi:hypothetical protein